MLSVLNVRSNSHNSCEDSVYTQQDEKYIWGVVADGCSTGIRSHFASQVMAYFVQAEDNPNITTSYTMRRLREFLNEVKRLFRFSHMNLLSTCIFFNYCKETKVLKIRSFGDGAYYIGYSDGDEDKAIIDENNIPNYFAYHLEDSDQDFELYLNDHSEVIFQNVDRFMICSDGIDRIERSPLLPPQTQNENILFSPPTSENYLTRMWNKLKRDGFQLSDDLTIVSYCYAST